VEHAQQTFKLSVPSNTANLALVRDFFEVTARRSKIADDDLEKFKIAVDEACANVIEHAYNNDKTRELTIHIWFDEQQLTVEVIDSGSRFDPNTHEMVDLKDLIGKSGGMGITLMKMATDEISWEVDDEGHNHLRLIKWGTSSFDIDIVW
jgi:serine/threonine-protein kinase RsbW